MFTRVKTQDEIDSMRDGGRILGSLLKMLSDKVESGMAGRDVDEMVSRELKAVGAKPSFLGYQGYPAGICVSLNDEVVHGIPSSREFKKGDLVSFDCGVTYRGMITDSAFSMLVDGVGSASTKRLMKYTERSLYSGIEQIKNGVRVGDISEAIQSVLDSGKFGIVRDLVGHGVGHEVHEDPNIPNCGVRGAGPILKSGMTIAIEPMATLGEYAIKFDKDGWTVRTVDGSLSAHFEHTVLVTDDGYEILTLWP